MGDYCLRVEGKPFFFFTWCGLCDQKQGFSRPMMLQQWTGRYKVHVPLSLVLLKHLHVHVDTFTFTFIN